MFAANRLFRRSPQAEEVDEAKRAYERSVFGQQNLVVFAVALVDARLVLIVEVEVGRPAVDSGTHAVEPAQEGSKPTAAA